LSFFSSTAGAVSQLWHIFLWNPARLHSKLRGAEMRRMAQNQLQNFLLQQTLLSL
jgi:hypothetical protein